MQHINFSYFNIFKVPLIFNTQHSNYNLLTFSTNALCNSRVITVIPPPKIYPLS